LKKEYHEIWLKAIALKFELGYAMKTYEI